MRAVNNQYGVSKQYYKSWNNENNQKQRHWTKANSGTQLAMVEQRDRN